jgi:hypothetical protein
VVKFQSDRRKETIKLLRDELAERPDDGELRDQIKKNEAWVTSGMESRFTPDGLKRLEKLNQLGSEWYDFQRGRRYYWWYPRSDFDDSVRNFGGVTNPFDLWFDYRAYQSKAAPHKKWQRRY